MNELEGIVKGLVDIAQGQIKAQKELSEHTSHQLATLRDTVADLSSQVSSKPFTGLGLRLPPITLPTYTGTPTESLDRFLEEFRQLIDSSGVNPKHWIPYLKQQVQQDLRSFDILTQAEQEHSKLLGPDPSKAATPEYLKYFEEIVNTLQAKRGKPKDQQVRDLLVEYYSMKQNEFEKVCDFAHRFMDVQTELSKLIPKIHLTPDGTDVELQHAFVIKLRSTIRAEIASREFKYPDLQAIIDTAQRYELHHPPVMETWKPSHTHVSSTLPSTKSYIPTHSVDRPTYPPCSICHKTNHLQKDCFFKHQSSTAKLQEPQQSSPYRNRSVTPPPSVLSRAPAKLPQQSSPICQNYSQYHTARCEQPRSQCSQGRKHICSVCKLYGCKAIKHVSPPVRSFNTNPTHQFTSPRLRNQPI